MPLLTFTQTFTSSGSWTAPALLAGLPAVYAWGPSGTGAAGILSSGGGGAGGGSIGGEPALGGVHAGTVLTITVAAGGSGSSTTVTGGSVTVTGNPGGNASGSTGGGAGPAGSNTVTFAGGAGGTNAGGTAGSGGGGSAGSTGAGGNGAAAGTGGTAGTGAAGLGGAAGGSGVAGGVGGAGTVPGSGPAGGGSSSQAAGASAGGQAVIIWQVWVPPQPVLSRRYPSRARWAGPAHPGAAVPPVPVPASGSLVIRRVPSSAVWGGYAATGGGAAILPGQIQSSGFVIIRRITNTGGTWGGYAAVSNIPAPPVIPTGPPPAIPTSGGTINPWIRTWRAIAPGDVPASGAEIPKIHGRGYVGVADGHVEDVIHEPTPVAGPTIIDLAADAAAAAARQLDEIKASALDIGRIFADPPYQPKQVKRCGVIRRVGGVLLTCGRKPGHVGKHSDRGLDWR